jgi:hypothetical protein
MSPANGRTKNAPPRITLNDRKLLFHAELDESVGFREGHRLVFIDDKELWKVPCLAICSQRDSPQHALYFCDEEWHVIGVAMTDTVDDAKKRAEYIFPGSAQRWIG